MRGCVDKAATDFCFRRTRLKNKQSDSSKLGERLVRKQFIIHVVYGEIRIEFWELFIDFDGSSKKTMIHKMIDCAITWLVRAYSRMVVDSWDAVRVT
jgi:hypothetical protein